jgi:predicted Fe-S protein YdhL (DUF1289 family)
VSTVKSPCISVCCLNEADVCIGCWRHVEEITGWRAMDDDQRRQVLRLAAQRARAAQPLTLD